MLKTNILATDITNLTDARYFAAWGVKLMSFVGDPHSDKYVSPADVKEIIDWVEGPEFMINYPGLDIDPLNLEQISLLDISHLQVSRFIDIPKNALINSIYREAFPEDIESSEVGGNFILKISFEDLFSNPKIEDFLSNNTVYLDGNYSLKEIHSIIEKLPLEGIVLRGGEEEKVGLKSFDDVDDILESLEVFE